VTCDLTLQYVEEATVAKSLHRFYERAYTSVRGRTHHRSSDVPTYKPSAIQLLSTGEG
jgi:hypothetical protein